jgi:hypothetical protein
MTMMGKMKRRVKNIPAFSYSQRYHTKSKQEVLKQVQHDMGGTYHYAAEDSYDDRQWTGDIAMTTAQIKRFAEDAGSSPA